MRIIIMFVLILCVGIIFFLAPVGDRMERAGESMALSEKN